MFGEVHLALAARFLRHAFGLGRSFLRTFRCVCLFDLWLFGCLVCVRVTLCLTHVSAAVNCAMWNTEHGMWNPQTT